jgi:chromosome segregation ATPase
MSLILVCLAIGIYVFHFQLRNRTKTDHVRQESSMSDIKTDILNKHSELKQHQKDLVLKHEDLMGKHDYLKNEQQVMKQNHTKLSEKQNFLETEQQTIKQNHLELSEKHQNDYDVIMKEYTDKIDQLDMGYSSKLDKTDKKLEAVADRVVKIGGDEPEQITGYIGDLTNRLNTIALKEDGTYWTMGEMDQKLTTSTAEMQTSVTDLDQRHAQSIGELSTTIAGFDGKYAPLDKAIWDTLSVTDNVRLPDPMNINVGSQSLNAYVESVIDKKSLEGSGGGTIV